MVRDYTRVTDETRAQLINYIKEGKSIKDAAELVNINYENAKAINRMYRQENRTEKKKHRIRLKKGQTKASLAVTKSNTVTPLMQPAK